MCLSSGLIATVVWWQVAYTAAAGSQPARTETTIYIGGLFEKVSRNTGPVEFKHYIVGGTGVVAQRTLRSDGTEETAYLHRDHLGSVDTLTSAAGAVLGSFSFDAFGKRRDETDWSGAPTPASLSAAGAITRRGFTGHEALDNVDLVHMNGRVYDPTIGRFVQADPFIQAPLMSQSFNRYSYVINNPLSLTDPSGFSWLSKQFKKIRRHLRATAKFLLFPSPRNFFEHIKSTPGQKSIDRYIMTHEWAYKTGYVVAVVSSWWIGGYGGAAYHSYYTYLNTGSTTEALRAGAKAAAMQYLSNAIVSLCSVCTNSSGSFSASNPLIVFADPAKAGATLQWSELAARAVTAALFAPTGPEGGRSAVGGTCVNGNGACHTTPLPPVDIDWSGVANDWWPGYQVGTCIYEGCSGGKWILGAIGAWPGGKVVTGTRIIPNVANQKLANLVSDLYKGARGRNPIGTGSTADAIRNELATGLSTNGYFHSEKGRQYINALNNWLGKNPNAAYYDRVVAESLRMDLEAALQGL